MSNIKIDNFIMEYENFYNKEHCDEYISYFENMKEAGYTSNRIQAFGIKKHDVDDTAIEMHQSDVIKIDYTRSLSDSFLNTFWANAYSVYSEKYSVLSTIDPHSVHSMKIQKIGIGEGYHNWHFESGSKKNHVRLLGFILYLNDVGLGGETEFLYYPKRVNAECGKLIVFPGGITHTHRGNPPLEKEKYILTGWVEF